MLALRNVSRCGAAIGPVTELLQHVQNGFDDQIRLVCHDLVRASHREYMLAVRVVVREAQMRGLPDLRGLGVFIPFSATMSMMGKPSGTWMASTRCAVEGMASAHGMATLASAGAC